MKTITSLSIILLSIAIIYWLIYVFVISPADDDLHYLTEAIYYEARGEPLKGQIAVAHVILNRVKDPKYPDTIEEVIKHPKQFSYRNKLPLPPITNPFRYQIAKTIANETLKGNTSDHSRGAEYYLNLNTFQDDSWVYSMTKTVKIGKHTFYKNNPSH